MSSEVPPQVLLRCARIVKGLTLADVAEATGLSVSLLSRIETGDRRLTQENATKIAKALGGER